jgi:hypothetical protein
MSVNWIKWCKGLADKREVVFLSSRFKRDPHEIAGRLMCLWEWCDENMDDADFDGEDAIMSLGSRDGVIRLIDAKTGIPGMAKALECLSVDWLRIGNGSRVVFKKLRRHNGKTAKERAAEQRKKALQRKSVPDSVPEHSGQKPGPDERKTRGDLSSLSTNGKSNGSARSHSAPSSRSPGEVREEIQQRPLADLSELNWDRAVGLAQDAAQRIPPRTNRDRRAWLRFGVLAATAFSEDWLAGAAQSVADTPRDKIKRTRQATLVAALKLRAQEQFGIDASTFQSMARSIEIPTHIWKSTVLEIQG